MLRKKNAFKDNNRKINRQTRSMTNIKSWRPLLAKCIQCSQHSSTTNTIY